MNFLETLKTMSVGQLIHPFYPHLVFFFKLFLSDFFLISSVRPCESGTAEVVSEDVYHYYFSVLVIVFRVVSSVNHGQNI